MKILGIQTSTSVWSVAVVEEEQILGEYTFNSYKSLSKILVPAIEELLKKINLKSKNLGGIAVTTGPGSFTGGRIGVSVAKGLSMGLGIPAVGVSTLETLAYKIPFVSYPICPVLPARGKEVYTAIYKNTSHQPKEMEKTTAVCLEDWIANIKETTVFVGEGAVKYNKILKDKLGKKALFTKNSLNYIRGTDVAFLAAGKKDIKKSEISSLSLKAEYWSSPVEKR